MALTNPGKYESERDARQRAHDIGLFRDVEGTLIQTHRERDWPVDLGAFSISLAVADMAASREFYGKLGFEMVGGDGENWTILANQKVVIGLFSGMFESNILTFNPGWTGVGETVDGFTDIRRIATHLADKGLTLQNDTTADSPSGPASFSIADPDGNAILFDQHV